MLLLVMGKVDVESVIHLKRIEEVRRRSNVNNFDCSNQPRLVVFLMSAAEFVGMCRTVNKYRITDK
ncbi:hypothetical protein JOC86_002270 [Bacillus pakistanensis]|uniref:Uncharacterized protein n=1 Tax=Rossellomorea pakistanensis TaxID=992288 RepID=A0ABS2ND36_9BACI|nr:hypothetical protein [Bacillus pakistanensis]